MLGVEGSRRAVPAGQRGEARAAAAVSVRRESRERAK